MSNESKENFRRCLKCGCSPAMDPAIAIFRFPKPGKTNTLRCELWAQYCFPDGEWFPPEFQLKLHNEHKVLCSKHFNKTSFSDYPTSFKKLHRFAVPENKSLVWKNLIKKHRDIKSLATRRLQQDPLENLSGCIRGNCGANVNPTAGQFVAALKTAILTNLAHQGTDDYRKCSKCGATAAQDKSFKFHRFPSVAGPRLFTWASYCWPDEDWSSVESLKALHRKGKMLCGRHFEDSCYTDSGNNRLGKFAVPGTPEYVTKMLDSYCSKIPIKLPQTDETQATSKDVVQDVKVDHCYTNKKEPPPPIQPILFNLRPKPDTTTLPNPTNTQVINVFDVEAYTQTQPSQSIEINEPDDIASADQMDEEVEPLFSWQAPCQISVEDEGCDEMPSVVTLSHEHHLPRKKDSEDTKIKYSEDTNKKDSENPIKIDGLEGVYSENPIKIDGLEDVNSVAKEDTTSMVNNEEGEYKSEKHIGYSCDYCMGEIIGFRYKCVECENFDLCRACESRLVHPHHHVLRLPRPTPSNEVNSMIEAIRERIKILSGEMKETSDSMAFEDIKEEAPFEEVQVDPFVELEAMGTVPYIPMEVTDELAQVSGGSGETEDRREDKCAKTRSMLKEWDVESEATDVTTSEDLGNIDDTAKELRKRKHSSSEKSQDRQIKEMRQQLLMDNSWRDDIDLTTQPEDIRRVEDVDIEWLDESILESEAEQNRNDDLKKMRIGNVEWLDETILEAVEHKQNPKHDLMKTRSHLKDEPALKSYEGKNNQVEFEKTKSDLKLKPLEQNPRKVQRKVVQTKLDHGESPLVKLLQSHRKKKD